MHTVTGFLLVGFFACPTLFGPTLLVFEFVVSPTHDYTTFSDYGSHVCINYSGGQYRVLKYSGTFLVSVPSVLGTEYFVPGTRYRRYLVPSTSTAVLYLYTLFTKYRGTPSNFKVIESVFASIATCFCFSYRLQFQRNFSIYSRLVLSQIDICQT